MTKKMTRKEALKMAVEIFEQRESSMFDDSAQDEAIAIINKMITQIDKQAARPKGKSKARLENEKMAQELIILLQDRNEPVNATWISENVKYCMSPQKAVKVAQVAEEWGAIERITIKKRTYYQLKI